MAKLVDALASGASGAILESSSLSACTKVDGHDGHNISCKIDGFGSMSLKSEFVKKA